MLRRIDTLYKERPTLAALYEADPTLFALMQLPTDQSHGLTRDAFVDLALAELGELQTIFYTAPMLKHYIGVWSGLRLSNWQSMQSALNQAYDPLANYDRTETVEETITGEASSEASGSSEEGGEENRQEKMAGFNSTGEGANTQHETVTPGRTTESSSSGSSSSETGRSLESHVIGNIGVTTSQQMLQAELELREKFSLYFIILDQFRRDICVEVW